MKKGNNKYMIIGGIVIALIGLNISQYNITISMSVFFAGCGIALMGLDWS